MNVLSLFDGMSCAMLALEKAGIKVDNYYASEVDKFAIQVSKANYPNIIQLGDINLWRTWDFPKIDLVIGGSPCQGFSFAGKQLAFDDPRSKLFFEYVAILRNIKCFNPNVKFLLENVRMKQQNIDVINDFLGVKPIAINSNLISAQNRKRLYWCNWDVEQPEDKGVLLGDILTGPGTGWVKSHGEYKSRNEKSQCVDASYYKGADNHGQRTLIKCAAMRRRDNPDGTTSQKIEVRKDGKTNALTTAQKDNLLVLTDSYRKLTPVECERLQTVPDNYTENVSNTQRYKMLGNGFTVDVIAHILRGMNG